MKITRDNQVLRALEAVPATDLAEYSRSHAVTERHYLEADGHDLLTIWHVAFGRLLRAEMTGRRKTGYRAGELQALLDVTNALDGDSLAAALKYLLDVRAACEGWPIGNFAQAVGMEISSMLALEVMTANPPAIHYN